MHIIYFYFRCLTPTCQMVLFSATYSDDVMQFAGRRKSHDHHMTMHDSPISIPLCSY